MCTIIYFVVELYKYMYTFIVETFSNIVDQQRNQERLLMNEIAYFVQKHQSNKKKCKLVRKEKR